MARASICVLVGLAIGCGSSDSNDLYGDGGYSGGPASGGSTSAGGSSSGGAPGSGGSPSSGGVPGAGGVPGTGGAGPADAGTGGGTLSDASASDASMSDAASPGDGATLSGCAALQACCATLLLPQLRLSCETQASTQQDFTCDSLIGFYCGGNEADAGGGGNECDQLEPCCNGLVPEQRTQCEQLVALNFPFACGTMLTSLQGSGLCN